MIGIYFTTHEQRAPPPNLINYFPTFFHVHFVVRLSHALSQVRGRLQVPPLHEPLRERVRIGVLHDQDHLQVGKKFKLLKVFFRDRTREINSRSIMTDPDIHQRLHDSHYEQQSRYYGYWYGTDLFAYDSQVGGEKFKNNCFSFQIFWFGK